MTRTEKLASKIAEEWENEHKTFELITVLTRLTPCLMCSNYLKDVVAYTDSRTGKIKTTNCMALLQMMQNNNYSFGCSQGIEDYMNEEVE